MVGAQIGQYRIERELGRGGFGVVYIATDLRLNRPAAIKQLLPELCNNHEIVKRFFNEAQAAAGINHPGIIEIYDVGWHTDGSAYFAMKFLHGDSLAKRLRTTGPGGWAGQMPVELAATIGRQVASALGAAHARDIVHRDLKPDNIVMVADDEVSIGERATVLDFGIAKLAGSQQHSQRTRTGMMMGTPGYMSPEQCRGAGEVDHRTDIYALGCILFEMLTGRPPFVGEGAGEVLGMHQFVEPPTVSSLRAQVPPDFEALIMRCLAKKPDQRFQTMAELYAGLQRFAAAGPQSQEQPAQSSQAAMARSVASARTQPDTTLSTAAASAPVIQPNKSKLGFAIGGGVVLAGGIAIAVVMSGSAGGSKTTLDAPVAIVDERSIDAAVAFTPDAAETKVVDAAPAIIDAAMTVAAGGDLHGKQIAKCLELRNDRKWAELEQCTRDLEVLGAPTDRDRRVVTAAQTKDLRESALAEGKAEVAVRRIDDELKIGNLRGARNAFTKLPASSVYFAETKERLEKAEARAEESLVQDLRATVSKDCVAYRKRINEAALVTGERQINAAKSKVPCVASVVASAPAQTCKDTGCADGLTCASNGKCEKKAPAVERCADASALAEAEQKAEDAFRAGSFAAALGQFEQLLKCKPSLAAKAYMAACKARNFPRAKSLFSILGRDNLAQICLKEGFDPH